VGSAGGGRGSAPADPGRGLRDPGRLAARGAAGRLCQALTGSEAKYKFRYSGLYLLERSGDRYFLITDHPGRVILLPESDDVRVEFVRPENGPTPCSENCCSP
jgi:hypothetical protein